MGTFVLNVGHIMWLRHQFQLKFIIFKVSDENNQFSTPIGQKWWRQLIDGSSWLGWYLNEISKKIFQEHDPENRAEFEMEIE